MARGACASGDVHSARAGVEILEAGGNAVDAAVGAGLVACVTLPTMTGLGGAGIMTLRVGEQVSVCDFFASVPGLAARRTDERSLDVVHVDFEGIRVAFRVRASSIAVPGTVAGLWEVHRRHGRLPLSEVAAPALRAARGGFEVSEGQHRAFALLAEIFATTPDCWRLVSAGGAVAAVGERLDNPDLADTLECLVSEGPAPFYEGGIARAIVEAAEGWVTPEDLAAYAPVFREPVVGRYRGWSVHVPAMPSLTGGLLLGALAHLGAGGPLPATLDLRGWGRIVEALRSSAALRTPEYERRLFEEGYLQGLWAACPGGSTMHLSTADAEGNLVAYTTTLGESAGLVAPGTGVALNNFLGEADILPADGLHAAGARMMTGMCPTLLCDGGERWLALGSAGSTRIRSALLQVIVHLVDGGAAPDEAIRRPRVHWEDGTLFLEGHGRSPAEVTELARLSPRVETTWERGFYFGGAQAVERGPSGLRAGADAQRRGAVGLVS